MNDSSPSVPGFGRNPVEYYSRPDLLAGKHPRGWGNAALVEWFTSLIDWDPAWKAVQAD